MRNQLAKIWWSRLIISVRGYVANYIENDDEKLFLADDAFIIIHRNLVESTVTSVMQQVCNNFINKKKQEREKLNFRNFF